MATPLQKRILYHSLRIGILVLAASLGFMVIEHWGFLDALFMTVQTMTTVGFGAPHPLSDMGRVYTILLMLVGVGVLLYILSDMAEIFLEANPKIIFGRRKMRQRIQKIEGHQIVCGYGRTGQEVVEHFKQNQVPFVIIEADPAAVRRAEEQDLLVLEGDASNDDVLVEAGIARAKGIICALPDDTANTFIALTAKGMNDSLTIVSRAANPGSAGKMKRAGAHMVISPYVICGRRMATAVTHPLVTEFLDVVMHSPGYDLRMEQLSIGQKSQLVGSTLRDANIKQAAGAMILAVNQAGTLITNPTPDLVFRAGDELIALGMEGQLKKLSELAGPTSHLL